MYWRRKNRISGLDKGRCGAFTLAEVLAALAFMAIVIPVAVEGVRVAAWAGQVGERKTVAMRVADRVLSEVVLMASTQVGATTGQRVEGGVVYRWAVATTSWPEDTMRLVTVRVVFVVQGEEHAVELASLVGSATQ